MAEGLAGKTALVTGGTRGIGAAIAIALARAGCRTIAVASRSAGDQERAALGQIDARVCDVTSDEDVLKLMADIQRLDILVNCAGIIRRRDEYDLMVFDQVIDVNLSGTMRVCMAGRPRFPIEGGAIVNVASILSIFGAPHAPAYAASKAGIVQLTKSLAIDWAEAGIRVNAVAPGWIATELTEPVRKEAARNSAILARTPMRRWGEPSEVADVVVFLCSPAARFITGAVLPVDGGYAAG